MISEKTYEKIRLSFELSSELAGRFQMSDENNTYCDQNAELSARLRAVVETIVDGIITINERGIIDFANSAAGRLFRYSPSDLIGKNVNLLMPLPDAAKHDGYLENYLRTGTAKIIGIGREVVGRRSDGSTFPLDLAVSEVQIAGRRLFTGIVRDISERRRIERELEQARRIAEAASRAKSHFLRNMSHELRTPLTPILGYADLLLEDLSSEDHREMLHSIQRNGNHLLKLISRLLEMAAIDEDCISMQREPCEPGTLAHQLQADFEDEITARGLTFELKTSPSLPQLCWTDPARLRQILKLVLESVLDETTNGGIQFAVRTTDDERGVVFDIISTQCRLSIEKMASLFDSTAACDSHILLTEGLGGFGLPLAQRLAERIGGRLTVGSSGSAGSRFSLELPLNALPADEPSSVQTTTPSPTPPTAALSEAAPLKGKYVLLAEDVRENQRLLQHMLAKHGILPTVVSSGYAALTEAFLAESAGHRFDLILMDIQMPGLDGWEATRRLRAAGLQTPVIAITALAAPEDQQRCLDAGCQEVITKPVSFADFSNVIQRWLTAATEPVAIAS